MKKYILFGAGYIGKLACECLGSELVECFVDNSKFGEDFCGKPVISPSELLEYAKGYNIVITVKNYVHEVISQLKQLGIEKYYLYSEDDYRIFNQTRMVEGIKFTISLNDYITYFSAEKYNSIALAGEKPISKILIDILNLKAGREVIKYIVLNGRNDNDSEYYGYPIKELEEIENKIDLLIVCVARNKSDIRDILFNKKVDFKIADFCNPDILIKQYINKNLVKYKNIHEGERCFIIGNGPSLNSKDLETLHRNYEKTFACNRIYKLFDKTNWRPDYYVMQDDKIITEFYDEVMKNINCVKFIGDYIYEIWKKTVPDMAEKIHMNSQAYAPFLADFSNDITFGVYEGWTVAYSMLQIAAYMGFKEIYLLGIEMDYSSNIKSDSNHFCEDYFGNIKNVNLPNVEATFKAFKKAEMYSRQNGFRIYNATRGGKVEEFERVNFDSLF